MTSFTSAAYLATQNAGVYLHTHFIEYPKNLLQTVVSDFDDTTHFMGRRIENAIHSPLAAVITQLFVSSIFVVATYFCAIPLSIRLGLWAAYEISQWKNPLIDRSLAISTGLEGCLIAGSYVIDSLLYSPTGSEMKILIALTSIAVSTYYFHRVKGS